MDTPTRRLLSRRSDLAVAGTAGAAATLAVTAEASPSAHPLPAEPEFRLGRSCSGSTAHPRPPSLRIAHSDEPDRILRESLPGSGFLLAGHADTDIAENSTPASGFTISDRNLVRYDRQTVTSAVCAPEPSR
jgi:hypothetical protein